jgi:rfaE bifunctional protein nucleotidyltransferase chain/domain
MGKEHKVRALEDLAVELDGRRAENRRIVHCHGVFDLLHIGHIRHFEQARKLGDLLVVTVTPDRFVNKGVGRPAFTQDLRAEVIASLDCVDYVAVNRWPTAVETIKCLKPHIFAKGSEFQTGKDTTGHVLMEADAIRQVGGEIAYTEDIVFSSSGLINQYLSNFSDDVREYLADFACRYSADDVTQYLKSAESLRVLVIGETIIDEYDYCEAMGKSGKEPVLATRYVTTEKSAGGVLACANHVAGFCKNVDMITFLGEKNGPVQGPIAEGDHSRGDQEEFVRGKLKGNVTPRFFYKSNSPTIVKQRFVEKYLSQKLFEIYHMNDDPLSAEEDADLCATLEQTLPSYDVVIVTDYGHGMFSKKARELLCEKSRFLVVNTQSNAGNNGLNAISKYPRADYVCLANREYALETRDRRMSPEEMILHVAHKLDCSRLMLTQGKYGSIAFAPQEGFKHVPALATNVVDRVGAGDAVLCLTALCVALGAPAELTAFLGNVVGAEAVGILGNQRSIERIPLFRHVECLLKVHKNDQTPESGKDTLKFAA